MLKLSNTRWAAAATILLAMFFGLLSPTKASAVDVAFTVAGTPSISGIGQVGNTLSASPGSWSPAPTSYTYQWRRDGFAINFATSSTYTLIGDDYLRSISVTVTASRVGYLATARTSSTLYVSQKGNLTNTPDLNVTGIYSVGEELFAVPGTWPTDVTQNFQWQANYVNIPSAISNSYQLRPTDKNKTITLRLTVTKPGFNDVVKTFTATEFVKPATPKMLWKYENKVFKGKNTIKASATPSFGSTDRIDTWCFKLDGAALTLDVSLKGVYFLDNSNRVLNVFKSGVGCYKSNLDDLLNAGIRIDVSNWKVGTHVIEATVRDVTGEVSKPLEMSFVVEKTAPTVTGNFSNLTLPVKETFNVSASTASHSLDAPIKKWCVTVDGLTVSSFTSATFTNAYGSVQDKAALTQSQGCISSSNPAAVLSQGELSLDSQKFTNGPHELGIRVMSQDDEGTMWWSDVVKTTFKVKNAYIPTVTWNGSNSFIATQGSPSKLGGSISANIPGTPGLITLSKVGDDGTLSPFYELSNSNTFSVAPVLQKNTTVQIEVFDQDKNSVFVATTELTVSPLVKLAKPKSSFTVSTLSTAVTRTVTLGVTSIKGQSASCKASWPGGSKNFNLSNGSGKVVFVPRSSGSVSVTCSAANMAPSKPVAIKF